MPSHATVDERQGLTQRFHKSIGNLVLGTPKGVLPPAADDTRALVLHLQKNNHKQNENHNHIDKRLGGWPLTTQKNTAQACPINKGAEAFCVFWDTVNCKPHGKDCSAYPKSNNQTAKQACWQLSEKYMTVWTENGESSRMRSVTG